MLETDTPKLSCKKEEKVSKSNPINKGPGNVRSGYAASSSLEVTGHVNKRAFACPFSLLSQDDDEGTSLRYGQHFMPACRETALRGMNSNPTVQYRKSMWVKYFWLVDDIDTSMHWDA